MIATDVVVVGGGPAGSTVAWRLARAGAHVTLLDAAVFPRVKLCAGWVTRQVLADLELDPATYPHTLQPFDGVAVAVGDADHETRWPSTASWGIVRAEFDTFLLRRAAAAGADVREGARVRAIREEPDGVDVETDAGVLRAGIVVGAGGHGCPVARALGPSPRTRTSSSPRRARRGSARTGSGLSPRGTDGRSSSRSRTSRATAGTSRRATS
jgi:flavin-dependent dehydrogenase